MMEPGPALDDAREHVVKAAEDAGRDAAEIGMEGRVTWVGDPDEAAAGLSAWRAAGATHVSVNTMKAGLATVDDHIAALARVAADAGLHR